ncbi:uncharacterized protein LOC104889276 isoform X1 [Beta vulgaris subsp. vulgaris]|uniref:uncharacterized protein LOC104889276 isoform X1 n=1 Tax=Beta vulgaris subsp. vulgaris TaxID=3555 RepID=UPI002036D09C|nr:uncharacterized protein LOC104889276 isoform X1 [Beta vulgaris subsp. vulgaris]XP_010672770.2 uncharacterized protein LOC104889276 isoform X1 [Beta vulgaris subsp. vulgaris]XP_010672771.2 uncharacterized protein LOC104889276 isoform X1 [Beta vulgaris subsp. vulgaris]
MEEEMSNSTVAWSWVIEALAKSELVDYTLLYDLMSKAPPLSGNSGKVAMEAAALRCLEGLCGPPNVSGENNVVHDPSKIRFDPAETCEVVLPCILSEISASKGMLDELKWDVQSFVKHKRANLPKSTLELLKDVILEGTHSLADSLKEISGLAVPDQCVLNIPFDGGDPTSPQLRSDEGDHGDKTMLAEDPACSQKIQTDSHVQEIHADNHVQEIYADNHVQEIHADNHVQEIHADNYVQEIHADNHVQEIHADNHVQEIHATPRKKLKLDQSKQQHTVPVGSNQMSYGTEHGQYHEVMNANGILDGNSYGRDVDEQAKEYEGSHLQQQLSPSIGYHCREETDFAMKNSNLLGSHCVFTGNFLAMSETEANICMKCNKDGQLLSCSASSCPLLFHESCLGSSAHFDGQGNFYCPFCVYSRAIAEYVRAKEKVSSARKELSLFIGGRSDDQQEHDSDTSSGDNVSQDRRRNVDKKDELKKGANVVIQAAKPVQRSVTGKQLELSHSSTCMDVNGFLMGTQQKLSFKDRQGAEIIIQFSRDPSLIWNQGQDGHGRVGAKLSSDKELKTRRESKSCKITELHGDNSSESISDSDGLHEDKRDVSTSPIASPTPLREIPGTPRYRRKKVPWTAEEEAVLKKGVELYQGGSRATPWKSILEFGGSVFQKGRTAIDLKDKWRNITRGTSPKVKN